MFFFVSSGYNDFMIFHMFVWFLFCFVYSKTSKPEDPGTTGRDRSQAAEVTDVSSTFSCTLKQVSSAKY